MIDSPKSRRLTPPLPEETEPHRLSRPASDVTVKWAPDEPTLNSMSYALAEISGEGWGGDLGHQSVETLRDEARGWVSAPNLTLEQAKAALDELVRLGRATERCGRYAWSSGSSTASAL